MNQALGDIALNAMYKTCFKNSVSDQEKPLSKTDKDNIGNCFKRLIAAYKVVAPPLFKMIREEDEKRKKQSDEPDF